MATTQALNVLNIQEQLYGRGKQEQPASRTGTAQAPINAGQEGWLAPAQSALLSTLNKGTLSGGKPPFLTCIYLSLSYASEA